MCPFKGMTTREALIFSLLSPFFAAPCLLLVHLCWRRHIRRAGLLLCLILYTPTALAAVQLLHCVHVAGEAGSFLFRAADSKCLGLWQAPVMLLLCGLLSVPYLVARVTRATAEAARTYTAAPDYAYRTPQGSATNTLSAASLLAEPYTEKLSWWEGALLSQQLGFALLIFVTDPTTQAILLMLWSLAWLLCSAGLSPHRTPANRVLQLCCHVCWVAMAHLSLVEAQEDTLAASEDQRNRVVDPNIALSIFLFAPLACGVATSVAVRKWPPATAEPADRADRAHRAHSPRVSSVSLTQPLLDTAPVMDTPAVQ